ncbi:MAG: serine/threonine-protein kinase [Acidobacteriota bacterium]
MSYHSAAASALPRLGRYELLGHLATGGMAEIHLARLAGDAGFEKTVVVKRLLPELVASKAFVAMFVDEAKLAAKLDHPNVCDVYELGREGAEYFIVMPYLDGIPATELIAPPPPGADRTLDLRVATGIIVQACAGLHHAHELRDASGAPFGLVHRDVSPSNLFVTTSGIVKVLDFGIAKVRGATETEAGTIKGKTQYMAPEQLLGQPLDRRCDVFALGIVLCELVTHRRLFERSSDYLAARAILEEPIPRADELHPGVPRALANVIERALARDRDARIPDARALARAIEDAMRDSGGIASSDEIAATLRTGHGQELDAQRTRQLRIVADARSRAGTGQLAAGSEVATRPVVAASAATRRRRVLPLVAASGLVVAGGAAVVAWQLAGRNPDVRVSATPDVRDADVRISATPDVRDAGVRKSATPDPGPPDAGPPDAEHVEVRTDGRGSGRKRDGVSGVAGTRAKPPGTFSIDSSPFATIYDGDRELGVTPLIHRPLAAGHHKLRAVLRDGRSKTVELDVPAGKAAPPVQLTW